MGILLQEGYSNEKLDKVRENTGLDLVRIDDHGLDGILPENLGFYQAYKYIPNIGISQYEVAIDKISAIGGSLIYELASIDSEQATADDTLQDFLRSFFKREDAEQMMLLRDKMGDEFSDLTVDLYLKFMQYVSFENRRAVRQSNDLKNWVKQINVMIRECGIESVGLLCFFMTVNPYTDINDELPIVDVKLQDVTPELLWRLETNTILNIRE